MKSDGLQGQAQASQEAHMATQGCVGRKGQKFYFFVDFLRAELSFMILHTLVDRCETVVCKECMYHRGASSERLLSGVHSLKGVGHWFRVWRHSEAVALLCVTSPCPSLCDPPEPQGH